MIKIILATHGQMAGGILDAANLILGKQQDVVCLGLYEDDSIDEFSDHLRRDVGKFLKEKGTEGVLILVDLFGASPFNSSVNIFQVFENIDVVTGLSLPMLLEVLLNRNSLSLSELASLAEKSAKEGVRILSQIANVK